MKIIQMIQAATIAAVIQANMAIMTKTDIENSKAITNLCEAMSAGGQR